VTFVPISSPQDAFNRVCTHLRTTPYGQSYDNDAEQCVYGKADGPQCAIGCLMAPTSKVRAYFQDFNGLAKIGLTFQGMKHLKVMDASRMQFLGAALQKVHDEDTSWDGKVFVGDHKLMQIAEDYGLIYTDPGFGDA
jgi:hypothetical protein